MVKKNACIFISGYGTNLKALLQNSRDYSFPIKICLVVCNNENAFGIFHAKKNSIPCLIINTKKKNYEKVLLQELKKYKISIICLAGFMKKISSNFIKNFGKRIINIHPSLLPKFKGLNTFERALKNKEKKTGCTVHYVNKKIDSGKVIVQKSFFISEEDDIQSLKRRTQNLERKAYSEALIRIYRYN